MNEQNRIMKLKRQRACKIYTTIHSIMNIYLDLILKATFLQGACNWKIFPLCESIAFVKSA